MLRSKVPAVHPGQKILQPPSLLIPENEQTGQEKGHHESLAQDQETEPAAINTLPLGSSVAVAPERSWFMLGVDAAKVLVAAS